MNKLDMQKNDLFEYMVYKLVQWYRETHEGQNPQLTKLRLQKVLFLLSAVNATLAEKGLLQVFNRFYAYPLGPVEIDIYNAMNKNLFAHIRFEGTECEVEEMSDDMFLHIEEKFRTMVDEAIQSLQKFDRDYLAMPAYDLVEITHNWTAWQVARLLAKIDGDTKVRITSSDICNSLVKAF